MILFFACARNQGVFLLAKSFLHNGEALLIHFIAEESAAPVALAGVIFLPTQLPLPRKQIFSAQRQVNRLPVVVKKFHANLFRQKQILEARLREVEK